MRFLHSLIKFHSLDSTLLESIYIYYIVGILISKQRNLEFRLVSAIKIHMLKLIPNMMYKEAGSSRGA